VSGIAMPINSMYHIDESSSISELQTMYIGDKKSDCFCIDLKSVSMYGRTTEQIKLLSAYQDVILDQNSKKVIIHGDSGSGKTTLVNSIRNSVLQNGGYFVTGKFYQGSDLQEPHSAIVAAFSDICDLVAQSRDFNVANQQRIQDELGVDGKILKRFISNKSPFLCNEMLDSWCVENDEIIDYHNESSLAQFTVACNKFLKVMASKRHPIVLFIDDIHWMDEGSKELIRALLKDTNSKHLMIILSYRDEEEYSIRGLFDGLNSPIDNISLSNLDVSSVHHLVTEILGTTSSEIRSLSEIVMEKSGGNPLHVLLFLEMIQRKNLLVYQEKFESWIFNINEIQKVAINSTDMLMRKIKTVSPEIVELIKLASMIGFSFEVPFLLSITHSMKNKNSSDAVQEEIKARGIMIQKSLTDAVNIGLLLRVSNDIFSFAHDEIQSAFCFMISADEKAAIHLSIGEKYLDRGRDGVNTYNTAVHWNAAMQIKKDCIDSLQIAQINLEAAKYCYEKAAFAKGAALLRFGLTVIDDKDKWEKNYSDVTFHCMEMLAQMELVLGNFQSCKDIVDKTITRAISTEMKLNLLVIGIEARITAFELDEALITATRALSILGLKIPQKVSIFDVVTKFLHLRCLLRSTSDEDVLNLQIIQDKTIATTVKILVFLCTYSILKNQTYIAIYSAILAVFMTLKHGLSPYSANAFAIYGVAEVALGNCNKGFKYGCLAQNIQLRLNNKATACATMGFTLTGLSFWKDSLHSLQPKLHIAGNCGFEVGDIMFGKLQ
jgi:predicted ATPase